MTPTAENFNSMLYNIFASAQSKGETYVDVKAGDLHRQVGGYPGNNHRMTVCCDVMKRNMNPEDQILQQPSKGKGASLVVRYKLHR